MKKTYIIQSENAFKEFEGTIEEVTENLKKHLELFYGDRVKVDILYNRENGATVIFETTGSSRVVYGRYIIEPKQ